MTSSPTLIRVITWLPVGGIERRLVAVVPRLKELGWNARVVCVRERGPLASELEEQGIPVDVIPFRSRLAPGGLKQLAGYFRQHQARVVHSHMYRSNIPATVSGALARVPVVFGQIHNVDSWDNNRQALMDRALARFRTGTLAVSRAVQRDVMQRLHLPETKVPLLYNGIDVDAFVPDAVAGESLRREWNAAPDDVVFVVPARLHPQKNPFGVLDSFSKGAPAGAMLVFVGGGKLEAELAARAKGSGARVLLAGEHNDMKAVYNAADAVVLSSLKEGFSNAVVEALACGKPVIASDVGGNREAISESRFGWIHDARDHQTLAAQLVEAAGLGREGLAAMREACRARASAFSIDALIRRTHELYTSALGHGP